MPTMWAMEEFLTHRRLALVGVAPEVDGPVRRMLASMRDRGWDVVPVGPPDDPHPAEPASEHPVPDGRDAQAEVRSGDWYATVADVPGPVDGAVLVVRPERAATAIRSCAAAGIGRVWLHAAAVGDAEHIAAVRSLCAALGVELVLGTCPLLVARLLPDAPRPTARTPTLVPVGGTAGRGTGRWRRSGPRRTPTGPGCDLARTAAGWPCGGHAGCRPA